MTYEIKPKVNTKWSPKVTVVNLYRDAQEPGSHREYCGRAGKGQEGVLGNPFFNGTRDENCKLFQEWLNKTIECKGEDNNILQPPIKLNSKGNVVDDWDYKKGDWKDDVKHLSQKALWSKLQELVEIAKTKHLELACFCSPKKCHCDTIKAYIEQQLESSMNQEYKQPTYTPENITELKPNEIFVFGSNTEGRHGKGAALQAMKFGAKYGKPEGFQGQCYAIVTKELRCNHPKITLDDISLALEVLRINASSIPDTTFLVTKIGCGLGGYTVEEIANLFVGLDMPDNIVLPKEFWDYILDYDEDHPKVVKARSEESKMKEFELIGNLGIDKANTLLNQVSTEQFTRTNAYSAMYYGTCSYKYTGANHPAKEIPEYLSDLASELEVKENLPNGYFNMVLINRYPSNKGLGRHRDNEPEITALSSIASISLGASRVFSITKGYNNPYMELELTHGDIVMMRGRSQIDYYHAVIPGEGIRYNLTFRHNANAPKREIKMKTQINENPCLCAEITDAIEQRNREHAAIKANKIGIISPVKVKTIKPELKQIPSMTYAGIGSS